MNFRYLQERFVGCKIGVTFKVYNYFFLLTFFLVLFVSIPSSLNAATFTVDDTITADLVQYVQEYPVVSIKNNGDIVVAFFSYEAAKAAFNAGGDQQALDIYARRFEFNGTAIAAVAAIKSNGTETTGNDRGWVDIAHIRGGGNAGNIIVNYAVSGGSFFKVSEIDINQNLIWPADGSAAEKTISNAGGNQNEAAIGINWNTGDFVGTFSGEGIAGDALAVAAHRYTSLGASNGNEFLVNSTTAGFQEHQDAAMDANGNVYVVFDTDFANARIRKFDNTNTAADFNPGDLSPSNDRLINGGVVQTQAPRVAVSSDGSRVITVYRDEVTDGNATAGVYGDLYDSTGAIVNVKDGFLISGNAVGTHEYNADVAMNYSNGDFVVVWTTGARIKARFYDSNGNAITNEFDVSDAGSFDQPRVAMNDNGQVAVVWAEVGSAAGNDISARTFTLVKTGNVTVKAGTGVDLTFDNATAGGKAETSDVTAQANLDSFLADPQVGKIMRVRSITNTATFTGNVVVAFSYDQSDYDNSGTTIPESQLKLFRNNGGIIIDITGPYGPGGITVDTVNNIVYGRTTGFSDFGVGVNPEPSTILMLLLSLGGLWRWARRR